MLPSLRPGVIAPPFQPSRWLQGEPVTIPPDASSAHQPPVTLIECFASWCKPCRECIPHIDALYKKHERKDLAVAGIAVWESGDADDIEEKIRTLMNDIGSEKMSYPVAIDDPVAGPKVASRPASGKIAQAYLVAAGQNGIPCAFVVARDGRLAWIGHPLACDEVVEKCIAGTFDVDRAAGEHEVAYLRKQVVAAIKKEFDKAVWDKDYEAAEVKAKELAEIDPRNGMPILVQLYRNSLKEPAKAVSYLDSLLARTDDDFPLSLKQRVSFLKLDVLLKDSKDFEAAADHARVLLSDLESLPESENTNAASLLSSLAHSLVPGFLSLNPPNVDPETRKEISTLAVTSARSAISRGGRTFEMLGTCADALWEADGMDSRQEAVQMLKEATNAEDSPGGMAVRRLEAKVETWEKEL